MAQKKVRVNDQIRVSPVRLIGLNGEQIGIIPIKEAQQRARDASLDLVEVSANSRPPVCRIMDYGKYKYEQSKKARQAKKKQHTVELKSMRYRPKIDEHDFQFKTRHVREFLMQGSKVKVFVMFSGREMAHTEYGHKLLKRLVEELEDISTVGQEPKMEGRRLNMILTPKLQAIKSKKKRSENAEDKDEPVGSQAVQENGHG
ncbi:MAG: translation initiation factor IF-3 [Candidatus Zixiibacteriota bacterium]|nr:MAG: translation initiation factor IF-3 [candidate division Zixibacteria bacterium]